VSGQCRWSSVRPDGRLKPESRTHETNEEAMVRAGEVYENPATGERAVIRGGTAESEGELLVVDLYVRPGRAVMSEQVHPNIEESFTVAHGASATGWTGVRALRGRGSACIYLTGRRTTGGTPARRRRRFWWRSALPSGSRR
jgi:hypothetical protein